MAKKFRFEIQPLEERLAPAAVVLGFNAHHDTVVATDGSTVVLGFNAHHDTVVVNDASQVVLGANAHHNTIVVTGSPSCSPPPPPCGCDTKSQPCC